MTEKRQKESALLAAVKSGRATHTDYLHPGHLRVEIPASVLAWNAGDGWHERNALCVSPRSDLYRKLNRAGLPKWGVER